jgi:hypothetical protein
MIKAMLDGTSSGLNNLADGFAGTEEEMTLVDKALKSLWQAMLRMSPVLGGQKIYYDNIRDSLHEVKEEAGRTAMTFDALFEGFRNAPQMFKDLGKGIWRKMFPKEDIPVADDIIPEIKKVAHMLDTPELSSGNIPFDNSGVSSM